MAFGKTAIGPLDLVMGTEGENYDAIVLTRQLSFFDDPLIVLD